MRPRQLPRLRRPVPLRRGIAILPSLFTVGNMLAGYYAIVAASRRDFDLAVTMVVIAGILDSLDGRIARMTGTTSEFGKELDSLSDFLSFGIAPAMVLFHWGLGDLNRWGWLLAFLLPVAGALRLARFNVQAKAADKRFFVGLPIPAAAAAAVLPLYYIQDGQEGLPLWLKRAAVIYVVTLACLMVSRFRYRSFKDLDVKERRPPVIVFLLAAIFVLVLVNFRAVLLALALAYAASGPLAWVWDRLRGRKAAQPAALANQVPDRPEPADGK